MSMDALAAAVLITSLNEPTNRSDPDESVVLSPGAVQLRGYEPVLLGQQEDISQ